MKYYKVWTEVEEIDEENDAYINQDNPLPVIEVKTIEEAVRIQNEIYANYYKTIESQEIDEGGN